MKIGNVSGTVLKRSILKQLHTVRDESMFEPTSEEMCAGIRVKESAPVIFSGTSVYGSAKSIGIFAMARPGLGYSCSSRGCRWKGALRLVRCTYRLHLKHQGTLRCSSRKVGNMAEVVAGS